MKKKNFVAFLALSLIFILGCSAGSVFATPTPTSTSTPLPTSTPTATSTPTLTPTPELIPGVNTEIKIDGMKLLVDQVVITDEYLVPYVDEKGVEQIASLKAQNPNDVMLVIIFKAIGQLQNVENWVDLPIETTAKVVDNNERMDPFAYYVYNFDLKQVDLIFQVDPNATSFIVTLPNGVEIDLAPFL